MTKNELGKLLGYEYSSISVSFTWAEGQDTPLGHSLKAKKGKSTKTKIVDYTLEECLYAMQYWHITKMEQLLIKENFIKRDSLYVYKSIHSKVCAHAQQMLGLIKLGNKPKVCATCAYLTAQRPNKAGCRYSPYCNFYSVFLNKVKVKRDIYRDRCESYEWTNTTPLVFDEKGVASIDAFGNFEKKILGFDNSEFTTGRTKGDNPIIVLK